MAGKRVLMVEGADDEHVVKHICGERQLGLIDKIRDCKGKDPLLENLAVQLKESDVIALGILLDADTNLQARWQSVTDRLRLAGYTDTPDAPSQNGTVIAAPANTLLPRVGIWLMPDNQANGILENFLRFLVPEGDSLFAHVEQSIDTIPDTQCRFSELKKPKAKMHTWLAWQEEPGKPFGQAISARYLDPKLPAADTFAAWLQRTFFA
ncbi:MAG: hypothetical protein COW48_07185 [Hydrogenophilales bacterium CG17_big_fil_post_rev_8_21_14_2_50_63_12]|nr:MAG: hypothetical protein COW48_07185 [Hydrogenophilales bacterium CG17_big_fil_post_rev_8_21_14_2_50_63_12]PIX97283.1 MAG: hypothetical protein COZ24_06055 [Hydrogenophilales bacterium CG_4_10_14_3_um_filter_63_21]